MLPIWGGSLLQCCAGVPDALLDSYERERKPHTRVYIETAVNVGRMMNDAETANL